MNTALHLVFTWREGLQFHWDLPETRSSGALGAATGSKLIQFLASLLAQVGFHRWHWVKHGPQGTHQIGDVLNHTSGYEAACCYRCAFVMFLFDHLFDPSPYGCGSKFETIGITQLGHFTSCYHFFGPHIVEATSRIRGRKFICPVTQGGDAIAWWSTVSLAEAESRRGQLKIIDVLTARGSI